MSDLKKRVNGGDFGGNFSDEEENVMIQMITLSSYTHMQTSEEGPLGSVHRRSFIHRDRVAANERIHMDYFSPYPLFTKKNSSTISDGETFI